MKKWESVESDPIFLSRLNGLLYPFYNLFLLNSVA